MYLRSITIKGFKSFPDRTRLEFGPGVSVVVGPNGSGKSNITDAVLWALGEQSPVAVRGQSMQDVIFAGSPGRKASSAAEVELVLDDSAGVLGLGAPEVSIVRRLDRGAEGEYRLAGARCRLVDVIELLSDTGMGKEMHSVISQGRVESLVTSKPRDRRLLIEEAAGLGKHRKRRRRAQLKLARTQDNLDRALDVEREARSRLRPLKRQAEAAELHARLERQSLEARWELARDELRGHETALVGAQANAKGTRAAREQVERELAEVAERRKAAEESLAARGARREELSRRAFRVQSATDRISYRADAAAATLAEVETRLVRNRHLLEALRAAPGPDVPDSGAGNRIAALEAELAELEHAREQSLAEQLAGLEREREAAGAVTTDRAEAAAQAAERREQANQHLELAREEVRAAERAVEAARREAAHAGAELAAANHFLTIHAGGTGETTLADQLEVDEGYELAVAAALEGRLRAAVVVDREAGMAVLDRAGADGARALVAAAQARVAGAGEEPPSEEAEPLAAHVHGPDAAASLARSLLGGVWVLDSLDRLASSFDGVAVTRAGRVWSARTGELRQAPAGGEERLLAERNRREHLVAASAQAATAELVAAAALERASGEYQRGEADRDHAATAHLSAVREHEEASEAERRLAETIERRRGAPLDGESEARRRAVAAELDGERQRVERSQAAQAEREARLVGLQSAIERDESLIPEVAAVGTALRALGEAVGDHQVAFERELAADRDAGDAITQELRSCAQEEAGLQGRLHAAGEELTASEVELQRVLDRVASARQELEGLATRLELEAHAAEEALGDEEREALNVRLERLTRRREQLGPVNPLAQEEYSEAVEHVEELERQRTDLETALKELERLIADTDRQIKETFETTFEAAARNFEQVVTELFPGGSGRLRLVVEKEGPARVLGGAAPQAGEGAGEGDQPEDADETESTEDDLLGVEIEINPAGKEMRRLSLLSGGEKSLTALAFLFAVFLAKPCPFYILDEVEAALDDLNIDRLLGLLRAYATRAQFIVVTHQKRTMEAADFLYGVSMGGDGISKVISRRLPREEERDGETRSEAPAEVAA